MMLLSLSYFSSTLIFSFRALVYQQKNKKIDYEELLLGFVPFINCVSLVYLLIIFLIAVWREFQWYAFILPLIGLSTFFVGYVANKLINYLKK